MYVCTCCSEQFNTLQSGVTISSQISKELIQLPENGYVLLKFNIVSNTIFCTHAAVYYSGTNMRAYVFT